MRKTSNSCGILCEKLLVPWYWQCFLLHSKSAMLSRMQVASGLIGAERCSAMEQKIVRHVFATVAECTPLERRAANSAVTAVLIVCPRFVFLTHLFGWLFCVRTLLANVACLASHFKGSLSARCAQQQLMPHPFSHESRMTESFCSFSRRSWQTRVFRSLGNLVSSALGIAQRPY